MRRRDLIKGIGGSAAAWPFAAVAQQPSIPVIGFLSFRSANESANSEAAFREGLSEIGYSEGRSVHILPLGRGAKRSIAGVGVGPG